jgi:hypothetical protein
MGGTLVYDSEAAGARFVIRLPKADATPISMASEIQQNGTLRSA